MHTNIYCSIIPKSQKIETTQISTKETINKMWYIHTLEHYPGIKKNGIVLHATTWTNLKNITANEISQAQKDKYCMVPLM